MTASVVGEETRVQVAVAVTRPDFAEFYREQWSDVAGYSAALVGSSLAGDEIAQEAFTRAYARWPLIREPRPYVFRIATNLAHRQRHRQGREILVDVLPAPEHTGGLDVQLLSIIRDLPDRLRAVILLHYYADLPVHEVAAALRRPLGSVKRQLHEGRQQIAARLGSADA